MRKLILYLFVAMIITSGVFGVANIQFRVNKAVNIRNGPGLKYDVIETITPPMQWKVYGLHGDWVKIGENKYVYQNLGDYTMKKLVSTTPRVKEVSAILPPPSPKLSDRSIPTVVDTEPITPPKPVVVTKIIIEKEASLLNNTMQIFLLIFASVISILFIIFEVIRYRNRPTKIIYKGTPSNL